jgi:rare lipoprotein A
MQINTACNARNRNRHFTAAALALLVTVAGATANGSESSHSNKDAHAAKTRKWTQVGKASWYGRRFQGHRTASGEAFDLNMLTCAHRTLPIGTLLRVTNLSNRKSIMVRVNDRGPDKVDGAEAAQLNWPNLGLPEYPVGTR